jgi:transcriptional regulator with XRE-family HTH domain
MTIAEQLKKFLIQKFDELKLKRKDFIEGSGISSTTTSQIFNADFRNPDFNTILKMANYFNCPLDEVTGRDIGHTKITQSYEELSADQINQNLKKFINDKLYETGLSQSQLGKELGFNHNIIYDFMQEHRPQKRLSSAVTIALADYFNISLDKMIGRTSHTLQKTQAVEKEQNLPQAIQKLDPQDRKSLQQIKHSVSTNSQAQTTKATTISPKAPRDNKDRSR